MFAAHVVPVHAKAADEYDQLEGFQLIIVFLIEHTLQDLREVGFTHFFWSVAFLDALDLLRVVGELLRDVLEFRALSAAKLHFVELQNVFPSLIRNVRFVVLRLFDWGAGRGLKEERDIARSDFLVGHEVFHTKDNLEAELVAF